jgi:hypothetical protein
MTTSLLDIFRAKYPSAEGHPMPKRNFNSNIDCEKTLKKLRTGEYVVLLVNLILIFNKSSRFL